MGAAYDAGLRCGALCTLFPAQRGGYAGQAWVNSHGMHACGRGALRRCRRREVLSRVPIGSTGLLPRQRAASHTLTPRTAQTTTPNARLWSRVLLFFADDARGAPAVLAGCLVAVVHTGRAVHIVLDTDAGGATGGRETGQADNMLRFINRES